MVMETLDYFYRAFKQYRQELTVSRDNQLFRKSMISQRNKTDFLLITRAECTIDEDWIIEIEKGLVYIGKAISEDRQFIRNQGDVQPIEKVRRVSQDSIVDLAKHSNYITQIPEGDDSLIPDKLLMINRENDYLIYENRVLFATLSYLKDFVSIRLDKIIEFSNKYDGKMEVKRRVNVGFRSIDFAFELNDIQRDDPIAIQINKQHALINRLTMIINDIVLLLRTNLMQEVSKAPLVKRPITKTNVLKMNVNFKESLKLFDFISAYNRDGYQIKFIEKRIQPLEDIHHDTFAEIILLAAYLTYQYNNELEEELHDHYIQEERRRQEIKDQQLLNRVKELMEKASKSGKKLNDYLLFLEDGYHVLERQINEAKTILQETINRYEKSILKIKNDHEFNVKQLIEKNERIVHNIINNHEEEKKQLELKFRDEMQQLITIHDRLVMDLNTKHQNEKTAIVTKYEKTIADNQIDYQKSFSKLQATHQQELLQVEERLTKQVSTLNQSLLKQNKEIDLLQQEVKTAKQQYEVQSKKANEIATATEEKLALVQAQLLTANLQLKKGPETKHFVTKDKFTELLNQKRTLDKFFAEAWKETKRTIRKKYLPFRTKKK
jgi:hypothetical protein